MSKDLNRFLDVAIEAARSAGAIHLFYRDQDFGVTSKSNFSDLVTVVDKKSEEKIREVILGQFPDHAVLGEEMGQNREASHLWVVDPLDGTVNYAHGFPFSCVSIGLEIDGVRTVGVVFDPNRNELFTAVRGQGAFLNGRRIQVSQTPDLMAPALLSTGFPYDVASDSTNLEKFARFLKLGLPVRRPGAAALDISYVACGRLDGFWEYKLNAWDISAGLLILEEAGGSFSAMSGESFKYGDPLVISNGRIQHQILEVLK